ncbi:MAG TPA: helix-turn-helix domain-containing protein [Candidatus Limnocylindrales bacterium]|nr:helix-turn-helix domain-containing protein [Candidatus Limnocylindrales bacterium]
MSWPSFDVSRADADSARGFVLIGRLVERRRLLLGLPHRQLELLSGIDQTAISRLENGRLSALRWTRFARLVDALGGLVESGPLPAWAARVMPRAGTGRRDGPNHG